MPDNPLDVFSFYQYQYGMPNAVTIGMFLGILVAGIYIKTRSLATLAILGIYTIVVGGVIWASEAVIAPAYHSILWIIAIAITSLVVIAVLKVLRE